MSILINTRLFPRSTGNSHHQQHRVQGHRDLKETRLQPGAWRHHLQSRCLWHQEKYIIFISAKAHHIYFPEVHNPIFRMYIVFVSLVCFSLNARGIAFTGFSRTVTPKSIQFTSSALGQVKGLAILCFLCLCERMPIACGVGLIDAVEEVLLVCTCSLLQSLQNKCSLFSSTKRKKKEKERKRS